MARVGSVAPSSPPTSTDTRWTRAVATVMPISTGTARYRVANVNAISWLLSPSSATKITPKLTKIAVSTLNSSVVHREEGPHGLRPGASQHHVEGLARPANTGPGRPGFISQRVDRPAGGLLPFAGEATG